VKLEEDNEMFRKIVCACIMVLILNAIIIPVLKIQKLTSEWNGTVYIRADGSIEPSGAPITTFDMVTYTLIGNITSSTDCIIVERDNILIDGKGYTLHGTGAYSMGIDLTGRSNVTIINITIMASFGILLSDSSINSISGNNITNNDIGIWLVFCSLNSIYHNNFVDNIVFQVYTENSSNVWDDGKETEESHMR
jgi:parallel beta-helix repeat protein